MELAAASKRKYAEDFVDVVGHEQGSPPEIVEHISQVPGPAAAAGTSQFQDLPHALAEAIGKFSEDLGDINIDSHEDMYGAPVIPLEAQAVAEGVFKQNTLGDSMLDLEQHRGIYARMGSLAPPTDPEEVR